MQRDWSSAWCSHRIGRMCSSEKPTGRALSRNRDQATTDTGEPWALPRPCMGCSTRSEAEFGGAFSDPGNLVAGRSSSSEELD